MGLERGFTRQWVKSTHEVELWLATDVEERLR